MCFVAIACLRSHRPTNPCWLHTHLPIHCTGNQLPRQPQSPCACLIVKTNSILNFTCTTVSLSFIHLFIHELISTSACLFLWADLTLKYQLCSFQIRGNKYIPDCTFYQSYRWCKTNITDSLLSLPTRPWTLEKWLRSSLNSLDWRFQLLCAISTKVTSRCVSVQGQEQTIIKQKQLSMISVNWIILVM